MKFGEAIFRNWIISHLRKLTFKWKPKNTVKNRAKVQIGTFTTGRPKYGYECAVCKQVCKAKDVQVDHINPVINPKKGFESFDKLIENMFCQEDNLQVLCVKCHNAKTKIERASKGD